MDPMAERISVLIAAAGNPDLLARTLDSLAACERPAGFAGIVVVENGPPTGIEAVVRKLPAEAQARYLHVPQANKSNALNAALPEIDDGLIVFTDDDARADEQWLMAYARGSAGIERGEFYGGPLLPEFACEVPDWMRPLLPNHMLGWQLATSISKSPQSRTFIGPNWAAFRSDLLAIGGFETRLGPGGTTGGAGQDTDAQHRLRQAGIQGYYLSDAKVTHLLREEYLQPGWILKRAFRQGLGWGIRLGRSGGFLPLKIAVAWARRTQARFRARLLRRRGDAASRLTADCEEQKWRGRWEGIAIGRNWDRIPALRPPGKDEARRAA
jgi:glycosyltransferase involved in cell wall biosynthesis